MEDLQRTGAEFLIQVAGAQTTPYAAVLVAIDAEQGQCVLKLVRPLPHELAEGAKFRAVFGILGDRFECGLVFRGRADYLQYRFDAPERLKKIGRRKYKRYPFRPREKVFVVAQDGTLPGMGIAGPLINLSMGGLAMRLDRIVRLDDGLRLQPNTALFDRGKVFPMLYIQDLPGLPSLRARGVLAHVAERGGEITLAFEFTQIEEADARALGEVIGFRENLTGASRSLGAGSGAHRVTQSGAHRLEGRAEEEMEAPLPPEAEEGEVGLEAERVEAGPLRRLARRTLRLGLAMVPGERRERVAAHLRENGFGRLELFDHLKAIRTASLREPADRRPSLMLVDLALGGSVGEPLAALRVLERELAEWNGLPVLVLCEDDDPALLLGSGSIPLGCESHDWLGSLDKQAQLAG
jgi:c-di-GMP-binding flagellar brake protein YcgR